MQVNNLPVVQLPKDTGICEGNAVLLSAVDSFSQYSWNTGQQSLQITESQVGPYILSVKDANGCKARDTFNLIKVYKNPIVDLGNETFLCKGTTKTLVAGNNISYKYLWQDGTSSPQYLVADTGLYQVLVTNSDNDCTVKDSVYISQLIQTPVNFLPKDTSVCFPSIFTINTLQNFENYTLDSPSINVRHKTKSPANCISIILFIGTYFKGSILLISFISVASFQSSISSSRCKEAHSNTIACAREGRLPLMVVSVIISYSAVSS